MNIFTNLFGKRGAKKEPKADNTGFHKMNKSQVNNFQDLLEQNAGLSFEKQMIFGDLVGSSPWQLVLDKGQISFGELEFSIQVIGSLSFNDHSWMWGWANSRSGIPENLLIQSNKLREIGTENNIDELTKAHFEVSEGFEHKIGQIACGLFEADSYYCANYGQGTLVVTIEDESIPKVNPKQAEKVLSVFPNLISSMDLNHENSFTNYLIDRQFELRTTENLIEGLKGGLLIRGEFDQGTLTSLNGTNQ